MGFIKTILSVLWRIWFYLWMLVVILLLSPALLLTIWTEKTYPYFFKVARLWAKMIFFGMGMSYEVTRLQALEKGKSYMLVANHTSMMDIMLMYILVQGNPFVFVGKKELAKLPLFGFFYKKTCILVDRGSSKSKYEVFKRAQARLNQGLSICIFPEGGVPDDTSVVLDTFKDGAFRLAIEHQIPIVPISFGYLKHYFPFDFGKGFPGKVPVTVHPFVETKGLHQEDKRALKEKTHQIILNQLTIWEIQKKIRT
jgi:1-acyl-sn-glycerol-3-phosphate acyltransferase